MVAYRQNPALGWSYDNGPALFLPLLVLLALIAEVTGSGLLVIPGIVVLVALVFVGRRVGRSLDDQFYEAAKLFLPNEHYVVWGWGLFGRSRAMLVWGGELRKMKRGAHLSLVERFDPERPDHRLAKERYVEKLYSRLECATADLDRCRNELRAFGFADNA